MNRYDVEDVDNSKREREGCDKERHERKEHYVPARSCLPYTSTDKSKQCSLQAEIVPLQVMHSRTDRLLSER